ncbi:MAG TPA: CBS domain-containing protein [Phycisphaerae bacterium]|jgi:CBS domain-containing protein|nr:CBS domain-containing protein [Phycisphaerae bacterium]HOB74277.1 CBS domain-containing protein [Phycisphaerae bacterium]HOJ53132.1 CBS domain-containing protein [Phycisphaerae bacterium]HOL24869.1 CBS domain-containing protein [Phycisphaerae bacterium]HPP19405.1 CBS domain-containing protein [Phycisphaerae bacterium]
MRCPLCGCDNLDGADACETCNGSLAGESPVNLRRTPLEDRIARNPLSVLKPRRPVTVAPSDTVGEVIALLARHNIGCALVVQDEKLLGIFTERDALMKIGDSLDTTGQRPVRDFMTPAPETLLLTDPIAFALNRMAVGGYRHIPLEQDGKPAGIISVRDVLAYLARNFPEFLRE